MAVPLNSILHGELPILIEQLRASAKTPQRSGANFAGGVGRPVLLDAVPGADVVEQEISEGMESLSPEPRRRCRVRRGWWCLPER